MFEPWTMAEKIGCTTLNMTIAIQPSATAYQFKKAFAA
jgi:hypothetical protein